MQSPHYASIFKRALKRSGLPVGRFAETLGITRQALHLITSGKGKPGLATLAELSVQHNVDFFTLIPKRRTRYDHADHSAL
jgi:transcriptional regulator with XRE-family HTH domain